MKTRQQIRTIGGGSLVVVVAFGLALLAVPAQAVAGNSVECNAQVVTHSTQQDRNTVASHHTQRNRSRSTQNTRSADQRDRERERTRAQQTSQGRAQAGQHQRAQQDRSRANQRQRAQQDRSRTSQRQTTRQDRSRAQQSSRQAQVSQRPRARSRADHAPRGRADANHRDRSPEAMARERERHRSQTDRSRAGTERPSSSGRARGDGQRRDTVTPAEPAPAMDSVPSQQSVSLAGRVPQGNEYVAPVDNRVERDMFASVNAERASRGLHALQWDDELADLARFHAAHMEANDYFSHTTKVRGSDGQLQAVMGFGDRAATFDVGANAENLAMGYRTVDGAMTGLMNSPGHKENILNTTSTRLGVGYYDGYWVQKFGW